jgi:hypothetical protein
MTRMGCESNKTIQRVLDKNDLIGINYNLIRGLT